MNGSKILGAACAIALAASTAPAAAAERTDAEFVAACTASSNLPEGVCDCSAAKARAELSTDGFALVVATLEGDDQAAAALRSRMPMDQLMKAGTFMTRGPAQCAKESPPAD